MSLSNGVLTVICDDADDTVGFQQYGGTAGQPLTYNTRLDGVAPLDNWDLLKTWSGQNGVPANGNGVITGVNKVVIRGGGGKDNLSVNSTTPAGTVIELYGDGGDDTLTGGNNTDELLVGGAGNDTISGNNGQDAIYGDDLLKLDNSDVSGGPSPSANGVTLTGYRYNGGTWQQVNIQKHTGGSFGIPGNVLGVGGYNGADQSWGNGSRTLDNIGEAGGGGYNEKMAADLDEGLAANEATVKADIHAPQGSTITITMFNGETQVGSQAFPVNTGNGQTFTANSASQFNGIEIVLPNGTGTNGAVSSTADVNAILVGVRSVSFVADEAVTTVGFDAISPSQVLVADIDDVDPSGYKVLIVEEEVMLSGNRDFNLRKGGTPEILTGQGGVSTAGFGLQGGSNGVAGARGIDNGDEVTIEAADTTKSLTEATLTIGLNNGTQDGVGESDGVVEYVLDVYNGVTLLTTLTGQVSGAVNSLHAIPVNVGQTFNSMVLKNGAATGEPFALSKVALVTIDAALAGGNDVLNGGGGSDRIYGQGGDDTINWDRADNPQVNGGDVASGGFGADMFLQTNNAAFSKPLGFGRITDFAPGADWIKIKASEVGLNPTTATLVYGTSHQSNKIVVDTTTTPGTTILRLPVGNTGKIFMDGTYPSLTIADFELF